MMTTILNDSEKLPLQRPWREAVGVYLERLSLLLQISRFGLYVLACFGVFAVGVGEATLLFFGSMVLGLLAFFTNKKTKKIKNYIDWDGLIVFVILEIIYGCQSSFSFYEHIGVVAQTIVPSVFIISLASSKISDNFNNQFYASQINMLPGSSFTYLGENMFDIIPIRAWSLKLFSYRGILISTLVASCVTFLVSVALDEVPKFLPFVILAPLLVSVSLFVYKYIKDKRRSYLMFLASGLFVLVWNSMFRWSDDSQTDVFVYSGEQSNVSMMKDTLHINIKNGESKILKIEKIKHKNRSTPKDKNNLIYSKIEKIFAENPRIQSAKGYVTVETLDSIRYIAKFNYRKNQIAGSEKNVFIYYSLFESSYPEFFGAGGTEPEGGFSFDFDKNSTTINPFVVRCIAFKLNRDKKTIQSVPVFYVNEEGITIDEEIFLLDEVTPENASKFWDLNKYESIKRKLKVIIDWYFDK